MCKAKGANSNITETDLCTYGSTIPWLLCAFLLIISLCRLGWLGSCLLTEIGLMLMHLYNVEAAESVMGCLPLLDLRELLVLEGNNLCGSQRVAPLLYRLFQAVRNCCAWPVDFCDIHGRLPEAVRVEGIDAAV